MFRALQQLYRQTPMHQWYRAYRHLRRVWLNEYEARKARRYYHDPAKNLRLIGITGTDGKTTTATMLAAILQKSGRKVGLISTVEARILGQSIDTGLHVSTPGPATNYALLAQMRDAGVEDVVIEATSHGLDQHRLAGLQFDVGIVTNISPEHLDYHITLQRYAQAKALLLKQSRRVVLNAEDKLVMAMNKPERKPQILFGFSQPTDILAEHIRFSDGATTFSVVSPNHTNPMQVSLKLPGDFNVSNALAAIAAASLLDVDFTIIPDALASVGVTGRWEVVQDSPYAVIVDFAHTPQAFEHVLPLAREHTRQGGRVIHVFGSAAQRDETKRSLMGELSGAHADFSIITMEDPRNESLDRIQGMLIQGLLQAKKEEGKGWQRIDDRKEAIATALAMAKEGDVVLITGKGHEKSLSIKGQELPWNDIEQTRVLLEATPND